jgi:hypothetical protein
VNSWVATPSSTIGVVVRACHTNVSLAHLYEAFDTSVGADYVIHGRRGVTAWSSIARRLFVVVLSTFICACSISTMCTLLGCESGITVHLASLPAGPFRIEVRPAGGQGAAYVFDCGGAQVTCQQDIFFADLISDHVFITVTAGGLSRDTEVTTVTYTSHRPNGPNCGPDCRTAIVTALVPG